MGIFDSFRKKREPISWFEGQDAEMLGAIREAQASFKTFVSVIQEESKRPAPTLDEALVKYAFPATTKGVKVEHIFLSDIEANNGTLSGTVSGTPVYTDDVQEGDSVEIDPLRVSDWLYVVDGAGVGGFTFRVMWAHFSEQEKSAYRGQPPFVWVRGLA